LPKERILIVDDEPSILQLTMDVLTKEGYDVRGANSSREALEIIEKESFDLLLIDVVMPDINGLELLQTVREFDLDVAAIIMTGYGTVDVTTESLKAGAQSFLAKPFTVQELRAATKSALEKARLTRENARLRALMPLFEVSRALMSKAKLRELFDLIVQTAALETSADRISLMLIDEAAQELTIKMAIGLSQQIVSIAKQKIGEGVAGWVAKTGKPLILNEEARASRYLKEELRQTGVVSALCVPLVAKGKVLGVLNAGKTTAEKPFTQSDLELLSVLAGQAATAIENAMLIESIKTQQLRLEELLIQLTNAQENERRKLSSEIHDSVAQSMISASYHAQACIQMLLQSRLDEARDEAEHFISVIKGSIGEMRRIMADLYPPALSDTGLEETLRQYVEGFQKETSIACHFQREGLAGRISPSLEIGIYRIVQEAVSNVRKHACATELDIRLRFEPNQVLVEIKDNGKGFDLSQSISSGRPLGHLGLLTMKDRAEMLGGSLEIRTSLGAGTKIILTIAIPTELKPE